MRRFVTLVFLLLVTIPFGISVSGCGKKSAITFCNGSDSGPLVGQLASITLQPQITGISLNFAQIGQSQAPSAKDCHGDSVSVTKYTYGTTDMTIADINPATGALCGGTWNRNTGGGIPDFTTCNPTNKTGTAYITASAIGGSSNPIPVFVHPVVTSVVLGPLSQDCARDPASNCSPAAASTSTTTNVTSCAVNPATGCCTAPIISPAPSYNPNSCQSQGTSGQLAARVFSGAGTTQINISCNVGHLSFTAQSAPIVTIDPNGIATAQAPGSTIINAGTSIAGSSAGFFSTCPPARIVLSVPNTTSTSVSVNQNFVQPITATVTDQNNTVLTDIGLQYVSTTPTTISATTAASVTPAFPGAASITAVCQPPACNPSPFNQIGLFGNGKPVVSNAIQVTTPGTNSTFLYIGSTKSRYIVPVDFTTGTLGTPVQLPFIPNSMVISNDGTSIYLGSSTELMVLNAINNTLSKEVVALQGTVLAVSPDNNTVVISDPVRQIVYLYAASGSGTLATEYGGVGTHAEFTPDSQTVYITAGNQLLVHSTFTGWTSISQGTLPSLNVSPSDVAVTVPSVGAFFAGATTTARGSCPLTTTSSTNGQTTTTNVFYPDAGVTAPQTDRIAATNDGLHMLGATVTPVPTLVDLHLGIPVGACPNGNAGLTFSASPVFDAPISGITASSITGVTPASDSSIAFITYTGTGGVLPTYIPAPNGGGKLGSLKLSGSAIAPVSGVFSTDNLTFYVGTSGDNRVHLITKSGSGFSDTQTPLSPTLIDNNGNPVAPDLLSQRPRKTLQ